MSRAMTKPDLIKSACTQFEKMLDLIASLTEEQQTTAFRFGAEVGQEAHWGRDKNLRDVLVHLYEWHQLLLLCVESNKVGETKPFLPEPYNWKTYGDMNVGFWEKHQATTYPEAMALLHSSHRQVMDIIEGFTDEELFEKKRYAWTGASTLGSYCVSVTASHYDWAMKKIKLHIKSCSRMIPQS